MLNHRGLADTLVVLLLLVGCRSSAPPEEPQQAPVVVEEEPTPSFTPGQALDTVDVQRAVLDAINAEDRSDADRELDGSRHPQRLLAFFGIAPGMHIAELAAGTGYTAELLARVVGPNGIVYAQNSRFLLEAFAEGPWSERLQKPVMRNVRRVDREFDDPLPPEAKPLDVVTLVLFYHDAVWLKVDRARMNKSIFAALKPGGVYGVVDHSAKEGAGVSEVETLHRIEEATLRSEIEAAGFVFDANADFLRNPDDARDWNASPMDAGERRGTSDRFILRFRKP